MYNSHFDFARSMHAININQLIQSKIATKQVDAEYGMSYMLNFERGYTDVYGNQYSGSIHYRRSHQDYRPGDVEILDFSNFQINDIRVRGMKKSVIQEVQDGEIRRVDWKNRNVITADNLAPETHEMLTMHFPNNRSMAFDGVFTKTVGYDLVGQKQALITGDAAIVLDGQRYTFQIEEPITMTGTCRWMQGGSISMQDQQKNTLGTIQLSTANCNGNYQIAQLNGHTVRHARQHNLWH